jgi:hypothetical protein
MLDPDVVVAVSARGVPALVKDMNVSNTGREA